MCCAKVKAIPVLIVIVGGRYADETLRNPNADLTWIDWSASHFCRFA
jgi:hypothetical protein